MVVGPRPDRTASTLLGGAAAIAVVGGTILAATTDGSGDVTALILVSALIATVAALGLAVMARAVEDVWFEVRRRAPEVEPSDGGSDAWDAVWRAHDRTEGEEPPSGPAEL